MLAGRRILVTGATGGIGRALCDQLIAQQASLLVTGRDQRRLNQLTQHWQASAILGALPLDLCSAHDRDTLIQAASRVEVDTYINLQGINDFALVERQNPNTIEQLVQTNLVVPMLLTQALLPVLNSAQTSAIIHVGSTLGALGYPGYTSYCASKFGLRGYTEALVRECADTPVSVSYIAPRTTATTMNSDAANTLNTQLGNKTDSPEAVATKIVDLLHRPKKCVHLGFPEKLFARINQIFPQLVDAVIAKQLPTIKQIGGKSNPSTNHSITI